jgi:hypothetical protein
LAEIAALFLNRQRRLFLLENLGELNHKASGMRGMGSCFAQAREKPSGARPRDGYAFHRDARTAA